MKELVKSKMRVSKAGRGMNEIDNTDLFCNL